MHTRELNGSVSGLKRIIALKFNPFCNLVLRDVQWFDPSVSICFVLAGVPEELWGQSILNPKS